MDSLASLGEISKMVRSATETGAIGQGYAAGAASLSGLALLSIFHHVVCGLIKLRLRHSPAFPSDLAEQPA